MFRKMRKTSGWMAAAALAGFFFVLAQSSALRAQGPSTEEIYNRKCAMCHAKDGSGHTPNGKKYGVKDVRETVKKYSEAQMIKIVQQGKGANMDEYSDELSPAQIKAAVEYYRSLAKKR